MIDTILGMTYPAERKLWEDFVMPRIWKHPNGKYYALWQDEGKTRQKSLRTGDSQEAKKRFNSFKRDLISGRIKPISSGIRIRFFDFVDEFLKTIASDPDISTDTERLYTDALHKAKDLWGDLPLSHITTRHMERYISSLSAGGLKPATINKNLRHLKSAIRKGRRWYQIPGNLDFPSQIKERNSARFLTRPQLITLLNHIDDQEFADFCLLSAYSGMRSGELLRLTHADLDNPRGFVRIDAARKNAREIRIPINRHMRPLLNHAVSRSRHDHRGPLFGFRDVSDISHRFKHAARASGLPEARFHDLRHTFGSHMAMAGVDLRTIQDLMGHATIQSTLIYAHLSPAHLQRASERLNYGPMPIGRKR